MKKLIIILTALALLASCNTALKQKRKFYTYAQEHPDEKNALCAEGYKPDTVFKEGKEVIKTDTVTVKGDSIPCPQAPGQKVVYVKCPDQKTVTVYKTKIDTIQTDKQETTYEIKRLGANVNSLSADNARLQALLTKAESDLKSKTWQVWILSGLLFGGFLTWLYMKFKPF